MITSKNRGNEIYFNEEDKIWCYKDTNLPVPYNYKTRPCGNCGKNYTEEALKDVESFNLDNIRGCIVKESIEESFKQIDEYKQGKRKFKSLKDSQALWDKWIEEAEEYIEKVNDGKITTQESLNSLIKAGICNNDGELTEPYKVNNEELDAYEKMINVGEKFKDALGASDEEIYIMLNQFRENNLVEK